MQGPSISSDETATLLGPQFDDYVTVNTRTDFIQRCHYNLVQKSVIRSLARKASCSCLQDASMLTRCRDTDGTRA